MHIVTMVAIGLGLLGLCLVIGRNTGSVPAWAQRFIWLWLAVAVANGIYGYARAGIPLLNEIGAFIPIFGIPAVLAWLLATRFRGAA
jgi:hypothetical protein